MKSNERWSSQLWMLLYNCVQVSLRNCINCAVHNCEDYLSLEFISAVHICLDLEKGTYQKLQGFGQNQTKARHISFPWARQLLRCNQSHPIVETERRKGGGEEKKARFALLVFVLANKTFCCGYVFANPDRYWTKMKPANRLEKAQKVLRKSKLGHLTACGQ